MVVVGNRGYGGFASLLLGSVSQQVAAHAAGPVVVVRGRADPPPGPIMVGVDCSPSARRALELGFDQARRRDCGLVAVRSYPMQFPPRGDGGRPPRYNEESVRRAAADGLDAALAPWRDRNPTVSVRTVVAAGSPAKNLVEASGDAGLLVVGSRGHGALVGSLLGSVGLQLLHHAHCPVMIVHSEQAT